MLAFKDHLIGTHQPIRVRVEKALPDGTMGHKIVDTTIGRIVFNHNIPQDLGFVERVDENGNPTEHYFDYEITFTCGKKQLGKIVDRCHQEARLHRCRRGARQHQGDRLPHTPPSPPSPSPSRI